MTTGNIKPTLWNSLSDEQREDVLLSLEESKDKANLIPAEELFKKKADEQAKQNYN